MVLQESCWEKKAEMLWQRREEENTSMSLPVREMGKNMNCVITFASLHYLISFHF